MLFFVIIRSQRRLIVRGIQFPANPLIMLLFTFLSFCNPIPISPNFADRSPQSIYPSVMRWRQSMAINNCGIRNSAVSPSIHSLMFNSLSVSRPIPEVHALGGGWRDWNQSFAGFILGF
jgi:hypothetical protein